MKAFTIVAIAAALLTAPGASGQAGTSSEKKLDKSEIEAIVRAYIMEHPEVVLESVRLHEERERKATLDRGRKAIVTQEEQLLRDKTSPWAGAQDAQVTVVQFFDYRCGYCKRALPVVSKAIQEPGVRMVYKELPILGPESVQAARLALAAHKQGKYREVHEALMSASGGVKPEAIAQIASQHGLDAAKLKKDMESPEIAQTLASNQALAMSLGVNSTPTFVIGSEIVPGAIDAAQFKALIEQARQKRQ